MVLTRRDNPLFLDDLQATAATFAWHGAFNSITMALVKTLSPGVPDFYQGCELVDLSMVDPDNRRPVDFQHRRALLAGLHGLADQPERGAALQALLAQASDGRAKLWAIWRALQWRASHAAMLQTADYTPLEVTGDRAHHVIAFVRRSGPGALVVIATRLFASLGLQPGQLPIGAVWGNTRVLWPAGTALPAGGFVDAIGGGQQAPDASGAWALAQVLADFPVAALAASVSAGAGPDTSPGTST